jgi:uncharacterized protein
VSRFTWVVKASKLCNMRCQYCYEYEELANRERMSLETWSDLYASLGDAIAEADEWQDEHLTEEARRPSGGLIVIHGGEPSLLPVDYLEEVFAMRERVLGADHRIQFAIQSNLLSVSDAFIDLVRRWDVRVGFSFDVVPGVRVALGGKETETKVVANLERMQAANVISGGISVIARHTAREIPRVYRFFAERKLWMRALPLFQGAPESLAHAYEVPNAGLVDALCQLFDVWLEYGATIPIEPLSTYLRAVVLRMVGARGAPFDPSLLGYSVYHVNTNGDLYHVPESYVPEMCLGNVRERSIRKLRRTARYAASLARTKAVLDGHCSGCKFSGPCHGDPLLNSHQSGDHQGRCSVGYPVLEFIEKRLRESGLNRRELLGILEGIATQTTPELVAS